MRRIQAVGAWIMAFFVSSALPAAKWQQGRHICDLIVSYFSPWFIQLPHGIRAVRIFGLVVMPRELQLQVALRQRRSYTHVQALRSL